MRLYSNLRRYRRRYRKHKCTNIFPNIWIKLKEKIGALYGMTELQIIQNRLLILLLLKLKEELEGS